MAILKIETTYNTDDSTYNTDDYEGADLITIPTKATHYKICQGVNYDAIEIHFRWFRKTKKGKWKEYNNFGQWVRCGFGCLVGLKEIDNG